MIGLIGAFVGAPLSSWISSHLHSVKRPYLVIQSVVFLSWAAFLLFSGKPPFLILVTLFLLIGYGNGASALTFAIVRQSFAMKDVGVVSGAANMGGFISAVLLPSIFGRVLDYFHTASGNAGYHYGLIIPMLFSLFGLIGAILIKEQRQENRQTSLLND
jgi:MFS family permease